MIEFRRFLRCQFPGLILDRKFVHARPLLIAELQFQYLLRRYSVHLSLWRDDAFPNGRFRSVVCGGNHDGLRLKMEYSESYHRISRNTLRFDGSSMKKSPGRPTQLTHATKEPASGKGRGISPQSGVNFGKKVCDTQTAMEIVKTDTGSICVPIHSVIPHPPPNSSAPRRS